MTIESSRAPRVHREFLSTLYDEHVAEVYRYVHRRCQDRALAEDITQDVFVAAARKDGEPSSITVAWLIRVAQNRLIDVVRREARHTTKLRLIGAGRDFTEDLSDIVDRLRVAEALCRLRADHRLVLMLHYVDGLTIDSLAEEMGRTPKAVEALVTRARRAARAELEDLHG